MTFRTRDGKEVNLTFYREIASSCAFIEACKSTVIENDKISFISGKIKVISMDDFKTKTFLFESTPGDVEICDIVFRNVSSRKIKIPFLNQSN